ncbi:MAG: hypothetical protein ACKOYN_03390 [Planctomycetota bacterium]
MNRHRNASAAVADLAAIAALAAAAAASAQTYTYTATAPALDRWNYPFNPTPGTRITASTFGNATGAPEFDNRDGQFIVGFNTAPAIPTGLGASSYLVTECIVEITVANDFVALYDPTVDPYTVFLPTTDALYTEDTDAGQPIELFGTGFRNGLTLASWTETTPFTTGSQSVLSPSVRSAYAMGPNANGILVDVSNSVRERWTPQPFAVGTVDGLKPGAPLAEGTVMRFALDLSTSEVQEFLAQGLSAGKLRFSITSLTKVVQGTGPFPAFYCRENPIVAATGLGDATISITVDTFSCASADLNCDRVVNAADLSILLGSWGSPGPADLNADGLINAADLSILLGSWS